MASSSRVESNKLNNGCSKSSSACKRSRFDDDLEYIKLHHSHKHSSQFSYTDGQAAQQHLTLATSNPASHTTTLPRATVNLAIKRLPDPFINLPNDGLVALTDYPYILVGVGEGQTVESGGFREFYLRTVASLKTLHSKPVGKSLLESINSCKHTVAVGHQDAKVVIKFDRRGGQEDAWYALGEESRASFHICSPKGKGGPSLVYFNHTQGAMRADGDVRPPHISLAHELIHALRLQLGVSVPRFSGHQKLDEWRYKSEDPRISKLLQYTTIGELLEELEVLGLMKGPLDLKGKPLPTENAIRAEHKLPLLDRFNTLNEGSLRRQLEDTGLLSINC